LADLGGYLIVFNHRQLRAPQRG